MMPDVSDQMCILLHMRHPTVQVIVISRTSGSFTERQREVFAACGIQVRACLSRMSPLAGRGLQLSPHPRWARIEHGPRLAEAAPGARPSTLTAGERRILELVALGLTDAAIASRIGVKPGSVSKRLQRLYAREAVANRAAAARLL
jgi:DNA-binding NarL/FixJ family response regulator